MIDRAATSRFFAGVLPAAGLALLPKLTCPVCWPAYSAALSALGLGFVDYTPYLLPLTALFVAVSLIALAVTARRRRAYLPLVAGALGASVLLFGRFAFDSDLATYAGIALLVIAPFLAGLRRPAAACTACVSTPAKEIGP